jgi:predicted negative regulator of RcsB-dependent stress response
MAEKKNVAHDGEEIMAKAQDFWTRYQKQITVVLAVIVLGVGGWYGYKNFVVKPKAEKAVDAMYKAEEYYKLDSLQKALNGDGINAGLLKVISNYGGTAAANLAHLYAGDCFLRTGDFNNAVKHLKEFSSSDKMYQARAYKLLGDAYSELGKNDEAISSYRKAGNHFTEDQHNSAEYLFFAASLADKTGKTKEAIELYKEVRDKFPGTTAAGESEKYLAKNNVFN